MSAKVVLAYITTPDKQEARRIGRDLVEQRLCACVNILDHMESIYHWEDKIEEGQETVLIAKTRPELFADLERRVLEIHPYEVPCVLRIDIPQGSPGYLHWLLSETENK